MSQILLQSICLCLTPKQIFKQHLELVIRRRLSYLFSVVQFHQALVHRPFWIPSKLGAVDLICAELDYSPSTKNKNWKHSHKTNGYIIYCLCPEEQCKGHVTRGNLQATSYRQPVTGNQLQATSYRQPVTGNQLQATSYRQSPNGKAIPL